MLTEYSDYEVTRVLTGPFRAARRLSPYGCISTDDKKGVIELVQGASTVANIHKKSKGLLKVTVPFRKDTIFNWLREHNATEERLNRAVREFSRSCAGYSVITFVLGIADRHSDNIMVKENGQVRRWYGRGACGAGVVIRERVARSRACLRGERILVGLQSSNLQSRDLSVRCREIPHGYQLRHDFLGGVFTVV